jgi:hypothetical protein
LERRGSLKEASVAGKKLDLVHSDLIGIRCDERERGRSLKLDDQCL